MTKITYESLLNVGFQPCIFGPIHHTNLSYYLGPLNWELGRQKGKKGILCNLLNWNDVMIIGQDKKEEFFEYRQRFHFHNIEEIIQYCRNNNIKMESSKSVLF